MQLDTLVAEALEFLPEDIRLVVAEYAFSKEQILGVDLCFIVSPSSVSVCCYRCLVPLYS